MAACTVLRSLRCVPVKHSIQRVPLLSNNGTINPLRECIKISSVQCRVFGNSVARSSDEYNWHSESSTTPTKQRKKTVEIPKVTLIFPDGTMLTTTFEDAQRLAKRRNLSLQKDTTRTNSIRTVYQLLSLSELDNTKDSSDTASPQSHNAQKSQKIIWLSTRITQHDLNVKINKICNLLTKGHRVKIQISVIDKNSVAKEELIDFIKSNIKEAGNISSINNNVDRAILNILPCKETSNTDKVCNEEANRAIPSG